MRKIESLAEARYREGIRQGLPEEPWTDPSYDAITKAEEEASDGRNYSRWGAMQDNRWLLERLALVGARQHFDAAFTYLQIALQFEQERRRKNRGG
jgi:hypothetical protein